MIILLTGGAAEENNASQPATPPKVSQTIVRPVPTHGGHSLEWTCIFSLRCCARDELATLSSSKTTPIEHGG
jgi:hypothetical protein